MTDALADFADRVAATAQRLGSACERRPDLTGSEFRGGRGEDVLRGTHLPLLAEAVLLDRIPVLFGILPDAPDATLVREAVRRYRNQAVVARSHLTPDQAMDLQLWLMGPAGSESDAEWKALALAIERDDRVARKLVWLPPEAGSDREEALSAFIGRTVLARPWRAVKGVGTARLDRLSSLLGIAEALDIPTPVASRWFALAGSEDYEDGPELVDALIEAWAETNP